MATATTGRASTATQAAASPTRATGTAGTPIALENPTVSATGLKYVDQVVGTGKTPAATDTVTVNYTLYFANTGELVQTTQGRAPVSFPMSGVIKGFSEGLSTMKEGGKRRVFVPWQLGYGEQGGQSIPPRTDLVFDIELVKVGQ